MLYEPLDTVFLSQVIASAYGATDESVKARSFKGGALGTTDQLF